MTTRQQRRLEQKLARKAQKHAQSHPSKPPAQTEPQALATSKAQSQAPLTAPISEAKLLANRANARLSTGAVTEIGKQIVAQNATKHGLTGKFQVLEGESQRDFDQLLAGFLRSEAPVGDDEIEMVHAMAEAFWLSRRSVRLQDRCIVTIESGTPGEQNQAERQLALYLRYMTMHDRAYSRYAAELRKRRNERARAERGFVSQKLREAADRRRQEMHQARQAFQNVKQESVEIRNRCTAAKAEALEIKNIAKKARLISQNPERALSSAA